MDDVIAGIGTVSIPTPIKELNKADVFFHEPSREETISGEACLRGICSIHIQGFLAFLGDVHDLWN